MANGVAFIKTKFENCCPNFADNFSNAFRRFSDGTSMHGFHELYYAKSWFWRTFWAIILLASIILTIYQVNSAIDQYVHQSSSTIIEPANNDDIIYPHLKLCIPHWMYWVNWTKAYHMGFSKESILYSMSHLTQIYTSTFFDENETNKSFHETLQLNNLNNVSTFFDAIAYPNTYFIPVEQFNETEIDANFFFCYKMQGSEMLKLIQKQNVAGKSSRTNIMPILITKENSFPNESKINFNEYNAYVAAHIQSQYGLQESDILHLAKNYTDIKIPMLFYPDGYSQEYFLYLDSIVDTYYINIKPSVHKWKSTKKNPCVPKIRTVLSDDSCISKCIAVAYHDSNSCSLLQETQYFNETITNLCKFGIFVINDGLTSDGTITVSTPASSSQLDNRTFADSTTAPLLSSETWNATAWQERYNKCISTCFEGCETWSYDTSITIKLIPSSVQNVVKKYYTKIEIEYPPDGSVLVMIETDSQSWESFIGNVGGLLGIWTGASILSLIQIFYLCCFAGTTGPFANHWWRRFSRNNSQRSTVVKRHRKIHTVILKSELQQILVSCI